jgi:hypothetical protein
MLTRELLPLTGIQKKLNWGASRRNRTLKTLTGEPIILTGMPKILIVDQSTVTGKDSGQQGRVPAPQESIKQ